MFGPGITTIPLARLFIIGVRTAIMDVLYDFTATPETIPAPFQTTRGFREQTRLPKLKTDLEWIILARGGKEKDAALSERVDALQIRLPPSKSGRTNGRLKLGADSLGRRIAVA